jgi:hypothetical protein
VFNDLHLYLRQLDHLSPLAGQDFTRSKIRLTAFTLYGVVRHYLINLFTQASRPTAMTHLRAGSQTA